MQEKALELSAKMDVREDFKASQGWLRGFKDCHGITGHTMYGESNAVNSDIFDKFKDEELPKLIQGFGAKDIYNIDETGLFFNLLPNKTLMEKSDPCDGGKHSKQCLTVLLETYADGTDKLRPLSSENIKSPVALKM